MAPPLSHTPPRVVDNFYQNSFKQLSMVQQKQVGLLVGAAVADAAARPLNGYPQDEVLAYMRHAQAQMETSAASTGTTIDDASRNAPEKLVVFARARPRGAELAEGTGDSSTINALAGQQSLRHHSFSYLLFFQMLRAMSRARGDFAVQDVQEELVLVAKAVHRQHVFEHEHASLLHTLCCLLPTPTIYPYASDAALRDYLDPFIEFLTESSLDAAAATATGDAAALLVGGGPKPSTPSPAEAAMAERAAVRDFTLSALGVVLRNLQSNPDPTRNAAFMAERGAAAIFPTDVQPFVPPCAPASDAGDSFSTQRHALWEVQQRVATTTQQRLPGTPLWLPLRSTATDAAVVCESLSIARSPVTFAKGVAQAICLGGPTCQRAMLVGALLGAKLGVRHVPLDWLSATPDHKPVATMALEVAQWSWNPPHH